MTQGKFIDDNFLLHNSVAEQLYHNHAKGLPIIDYHNHLPPEGRTSLVTRVTKKNLFSGQLQFHMQ